MKNFKYVLIGLGLQGLLAGNLLASTTYVISGYLDYAADNNSSTLASIGSSRVYPDGIGVGTPFSVSMTLDGNLDALTGFLDVDVGGMYQGHMSIAGAARVCDGHSCVYDYNNPLFPLLGWTGVGGQSASGTNLPVSDLGGGTWSVSVDLDIPPTGPKPAANTPLSELPFNSVSIWLSSSYWEYRMIPCPGCVEGYTYLNIEQGWSIGGTSHAITAVPLPAAGWLLGSALMGLAGVRRRRS